MGHRVTSRRAPRSARARRRSAGARASWRSSSTTHGARRRRRRRSRPSSQETQLPVSQPAQRLGGLPLPAVTAIASSPSRRRRDRRRSRLRRASSDAATARPPLAASGSVALRLARAATDDLAVLGPIGQERLPARTWPPTSRLALDARSRGALARPRRARARACLGRRRGRATRPGSATCSSVPAPHCRSRPTSGL